MSVESPPAGHGLRDDVDVAVPKHDEAEDVLEGDDDHPQAVVVLRDTINGIFIRSPGEEGAALPSDIFKEYRGAYDAGQCGDGGE